MDCTFNILYFVTIIYKINIFVGSTYSTNAHFYCYWKENEEVCTKAERRVNHAESWELPDIKVNNNLKKMSSNAGLNGLYRPRSALARALYEKQRNDRQLQELDQNEWYKVDKTRLTPELQEKFVQLHPDKETKEFLSSSIEKSSWIWTQIWYLLAKAVLKHFWSITDINGWLGRGSMFVLSEAAARALLAGGPAARGALVDIGAGDGEVSRRFAHLFQNKYATEISGSMRKALSNKGYNVLDIDGWWQERQFDCVCMLNLLDRCSKPSTMLKQAKSAIAPGGVLLLALVLPYKPYVEVTPDHKPEERLPIEGVGFEEQVVSFVSFMRDQIGFELVSWSRAPYLCEGDFAQAYYWLDDSVFVFKPTSIQSSS